MSLRLRLILLTVAMVALVALGFSAVQLRILVSTLTQDAADRSTLASQQVKAYLIDHIAQHSNGRATPANMDETRAMWKEIVSTDPDIANMLEKMMSLSHSLIEINVADENKTILVSSNPVRTGSRLLPLEPIVNWAAQPLNRKLIDLIRRRADYEVTVSLGVAGQGTSLFTVQVVSSGVLIRDAVLPEVNRLALISGGILALALVLTLLATRTILRPLRRIEDTIDRIVQGNYGGEESRRGQAREFAAVESKLDLLGQKFRGAREDASELRDNIGKLLERMATQIDVSARLAAISRLTGGVAHEIKNPLNAISLRLDLVKAKLGADTDPVELSSDIEVLSKEVLRLDRVVKTFLDFSRPFEAHFRDLDLAELVTQVCDLLGPQAKAAHVELWLEKPPSPVPMRGDPDMLLQVILNLVTNAIEAMKAGGFCGVSVFSTARGVELNVADTGPGIDSKLADRIFNLYYTTKAGGSGIGLALAYRAVQLHNGSIGYTSEPGRGTTFHVQFPAAANVNS
jgi:signal transduction histidine kinase